ncbi:hypothetical protein GCM10022243_51920 [Saccharothrix violaceirubra]|uniref:Excreted virulence factor EspC (Type VII ESX diderm) n=1 Tax=Saccharothrix violaceirubra TaxID=413306 RepID=A0A7W7TBE9_9PSEU|nr:hypothetical protein [Saccharothrix violaceirubra]MBB4969507.1 hypothetical protein [Saccharothrix violaceirubra]
MPVAKFNAEALEQCRSAASAQAGQFGSVGDGLSGAYVDAGVFGKLGTSGGLASAVSDFQSRAGAECAAAEKLLGQVERAIDKVESAVDDVEAANAGSFRAV